MSLQAKSLVHVEGVAVDLHHDRLDLAAQGLPAHHPVALLAGGQQADVPVQAPQHHLQGEGVTGRLEDFSLM